MMRTCLLLLVVVVLGAFAQEEQESDTLYITPKPSGPVFFLETFNGDHWTDLWKPSTDPKYTGDWEVQESDFVRVSGDRGLVMANQARHHAIGAKFDTSLDTTDKDLVIQYEVQLQNGLDCGGAYIKLFNNTPDFDITQVGDNTPYVIMFGPDKCGVENKVHFIVRHQNPISFAVEEKHLMPRPSMKTDKITHLYTLHVRKDNTFEISIDQQVVKSGDLLKDFTPAFNPPQEIDDPTDFKPSDWVDEEFIPDPEATKPADWDEDAPQFIPDPNDSKPEDWLDNEPDTIPDPKAEKPADWNDEEDGEWLAPTIENPKCEEHGCGEWQPTKIRNPAYKGKWSAPKITNPAWKGVWKPKQIPNPAYFEDSHPSNFPKMAGVGFELWTMTQGILFDNILVTHDKAVADDFAEKTWAVKYAAEKKKFDEENVVKEKVESFAETATRYFNIAYEFAMNNPIILGASVVVGLLPIFVCSSLSSPAKKPRSLRNPGEDESPVASPESTSSASSAAKAEKPKEKEEEIQADSGEEKKSPSTRKRTKTPRAD